MPGDDFRRRADAVRSLPLEQVLLQWGAERDRSDRQRWLTSRGPVSITGSKFFNWHLQTGSGGAIDLVMHLGNWDCASAVAWLEQHLGSTSIVDSAEQVRSQSACVASDEVPSLQLPVSNPAHLGRVRRYLIEQRRLALSILEPLIDSGRIYADARGNAVFLMVAGKPPRAVGAELRGTGQRVWRGLAKGTRKDAGYFWVGNVGSNRIVLCESAIDAISCFQMHASSICISTAGVRSDTLWLGVLISRGYDIYCGFDDDQPGAKAAERMLDRYPSLKRLRPPAHDWNDAIRKVDAPE